MSKRGAGRDCNLNFYPGVVKDTTNNFTARKLVSEVYETFGCVFTLLMIELVNKTNTNNNV